MFDGDSGGSAAQGVERVLQLGDHAFGYHTILLEPLEVGRLEAWDDAAFVVAVHQHAFLLEAVEQLGSKGAGNARCDRVGIGVEQLPAGIVIDGAQYRDYALRDQGTKEIGIDRLWPDISHEAVIYGGHTVRKGLRGALARFDYIGIATRKAYGVAAAFLKQRDKVFVAPAGIDHSHDLECFGICHPAALDFDRFLAEGFLNLAGKHSAAVDDDLVSLEPGEIVAEAFKQLGIVNYVSAYLDKTYHRPSSILFITTWALTTRLAASGITRLVGASMTSSLTIIFLLTGRQCIKYALSVTAIWAASTVQFRSVERIWP